MKGIMMKEPLVHQTQKGSKTETRRPIDIDPKSSFCHIDTPGFLYKGDDKNGDPIEVKKPLVAWFDGEFYFKNFGWIDHAGFLPRYNIGEVVYIKEPYCHDAMGHIKYQYQMAPEDRQFFRWKNKMFMPAKAARLHIKILDITVERICDISEASVKAEGVNDSFEYPTAEFLYDHLAPELLDKEPTPNHCRFFKLIKDINPKTPLNAWYWAYQYKLVKI